MAETWLTTLITDKPQDNSALALTLKGAVIARTLTDPVIRKEFAHRLHEDPDALTVGSTLAASHNDWRN